MIDQVNQFNDGGGDNIAGNKIVYNSIAPDAFDSQIDEILRDVRHKDICQARSKLQSLQSTSNLNSLTSKTLEIIQLFVSIESESNELPSVSIFNTFISSDVPDKYKDIASAALIRLEVKKGNQALAAERYSLSSKPGVHLKEAFYALLADIGAINVEYASSKLSAPEGVLCGLVRGALRLGAIEVALHISETLCELYPELNSRILKFACQRHYLNQLINGKAYWLISPKSKSLVDKHIDELADLFGKGQGRDPRLNDFAYSLITYQISKHARLVDVCNRFSTQIEVDHPSLFNLLEQLQGRHTSQNDSLSNKFLRCESDEEFRDKELTRILQSNQITTDDASLILKFAPASSTADWLHRGGKVISSEAFLAAFVRLELIVFSCSNNPAEVAELRKRVEELLPSFSSEIERLHPIRLLNICEKLISLKQSMSAISILRPIIPKGEIWLSPLIECYIDALLQSEQNKTLSDLISQVPNEFWTSRLWQVQSQLHMQNSQVAEAIASLEEAIKLNPNIKSYWIWLILQNQELQNNRISTRDILERIPVEVFKYPTNDGYRLLAECVRTGMQTFAEERLVSWFIADPEGTAKDITNFYFSVYIAAKLPFNDSAEIGDCYCGVKFEIDGKSYFKLIVTLPNSSNSYLLGAGSPLGTHLLHMENGEESMFGAQDVKLLERLTPMVAIFHMAKEIRENKNDGTDCFYTFQVPAEEEMILPYLSRKLSAFQSEGPDFLKNPAVPVYFKGNKIGDDNPYAAAIKTFTDARVVNQPIPNFGLMNFNAVVLDPYSLCYLALSNLAFEFTKLFNNIHITKDTHACVSEWLVDINRDDFLSLAPTKGGGLRRTTAEDIRAATADIQQSLEHLLCNAQITVPNLIDCPSEILIIDDHIDRITTSSYKLALANNLPWLCLDPLIGRLFETSGGQIINAHECVVRLSEPIAPEFIDGIKLFTSKSFPFVVTYKKLKELSYSEWEFAHHLLSELIMNNHGSMPGFQEAFEFSVIVICNALETLERRINYSSYRGKNTATNITFFLRLFNACSYEIMQYDRHVEAELKLAKYLYKIAVWARVGERGRLLFLKAINEFIHGHFLSSKRISEHFLNFQNNEIT